MVKSTDFVSLIARLDPFAWKIADFTPAIEKKKGVVEEEKVSTPKIESPKDTFVSQEEDLRRRYQSLLG